MLRVRLSMSQQGFAIATLAQMTTEVANKMLNSESLTRPRKLVNDRSGHEPSEAHYADAPPI